MENSCNKCKSVFRGIILYGRHWLFIYILPENLFYSELLKNVHGNFQGIRTAGLADFEVCNAAGWLAFPLPTGSVASRDGSCDSGLGNPVYIEDDLMTAKTQ